MNGAAPTEEEIVRLIDRVSRRSAGAREGCILEELDDGGWIRLVPGRDPGEFPSVGLNRVNWLATQRPVTPGAIDHVVQRLRHHACPRAFLWFRPGACDDAVAAHLQQIGASRSPHVQYPVLTRGVDVCLSPRATSFEIRALSGEEAARVISPLAPWFSTDGVSTACRLVRQHDVEAHMAFDGPSAVAVALVFFDGPAAYLGWAGTNPEYRGRGAQSAIIASRVNSACRRGSLWCCSETATAVPTSLKNLTACGFVPRFSWITYRLDLALAGPKAPK